MNHEKIETLNKCIKIIENKTNNQSTKKMISILNKKGLSNSSRLKKLSHEYFKNTLSK